MLVTANLFAWLTLFASGAGGSFTLGVFQGLDIPSGRVVKSGAAAADLNFTYQTRRIGMISYLGAAKIKFYAKPPAEAPPTAEVERWDDYVAGPEPGFYVLRARSGKLYLVELVSFSNQGQAASQWRLEGKWRELPQRDTR